jgi:hypothetical protein
LTKREKILWFDGRLSFTSRISKELFKVEIDNLKLYGYGIKGYILSMIEAAMTISNNTIPIEIVEKIIQFGKELLQNQSFYLMVWKKL